MEVYIMKVGTNREKLENEIYKYLYEINQDRNLKNEILTKLIQRGFPAGTAQQLLSGNAALEFLDQYELGVIAYIFFTTTYNVILDPSIYFDTEELSRIEKLEFTREDKKVKYPITFKNMIKQSNNSWIGVISVQDFVKLHQSGIVTYNFETQRNPVYKKYRNKTIKRANINPSSVKQITEKMVSNTYKYDDVTINILANGEEDFEFNIIREEGDFIIGDVTIHNAALNLIDGAHREKAAEGALLANPNITGNFVLILTNYDVDEANYYIIQRDNRNPIDREYIQAKDTTNLSNEVVKRINESTKSDLQGLIATDEFLVKEGEGVTLFNIMSKTIAKLWEIQTRRDARKLSNYLINFFNELVGIFPQELKLNIKENRGINYINHPNMFIYYLVIANVIQDEEKWEDLLEIIIEDTDFSKNNSEWKRSIAHTSQSNLDNRLPSIIRTYNKKITKIKEGVI